MQTGELDQRTMSNLNRKSRRKEHWANKKDFGFY